MGRDPRWTKSPAFGRTATTLRRSRALSPKRSRCSASARLPKLGQSRSLRRSHSADIARRFSGCERPSDRGIEIGTSNGAPHHLQHADPHLGLPIRKVGRRMIVRVKAYRDPAIRYEPRHRLAARVKDIVHDVHFHKFEMGREERVSVRRCCNGPDYLRWRISVRSNTEASRRDLGERLDARAAVEAYATHPCGAASRMHASPERGPS